MRTTFQEELSPLKATMINANDWHGAMSVDCYSIGSNRLVPAACRTVAISSKSYGLCCKTWSMVVLALLKILDCLMIQWRCRRSVSTQA